MSNISVFDCNIAVLELHPPSSGLSCTAKTCVGSFYVDEGNDSTTRKEYRKGPCFFWTSSRDQHNLFWEFLVGFFCVLDQESWPCS